MEPELMGILSALAAKFGIAGTIFTAVAGMIVAVNFLKATEPFSKWINNSRVPYVMMGLSLATCLLTYWGHWLQVGVGTVLLTVASIGTWSSIKMAAHKMAQPKASNASGGAIPAAKP